MHSLHYIMNTISFNLLNHFIFAPTLDVMLLSFWY